FSPAHSPGYGRILLRYSCFHARASDDFAGHYRARGAERRRSQSDASRRTDFSLGLPGILAPEQQDRELSLPHGLLIDVTVDSHGQMTDYQILSGPTSVELRRQLDQILLFSRFSPMMSFGRPTAGGHVVLSFSAVRVRG